MYIIFVLIFSFLLGNSAFSQEQKKMTKEEEEMMKLWQEYSTPGKAHKHLEFLKGEWIVETKMWQAPDAPLSSSTGTASGEMILGGRYLLMKYSGTFEGMKFEGIALTGYDNDKKKFQSIWIDNFGTGLYFTEGSCKEDFKECTDEGEWWDPIRKHNYKVRSIGKIIDNDTYINEMYAKYPNSKEFKTMELVYKRKK